MFNIIKTRIQKGVVTEIIPASVLLPGDYDKAGKQLKKLIIKKFSRSLHIREVDTGSCGACESEIIACNNPIYDISRFGINFVASPRHADCLLVTGPVSKNMVFALSRTFEAMPEPKFVIALGDCAINGGPYQGSYYAQNGISSMLPVVIHIPGCPPDPQTIIKSLLDFFNSK